MKSLTLALISLLCTLTVAYGQDFAPLAEKAEAKRDFMGIVTAGINGSQIDGDGLTGFDMPGIYLGLGARYALNKEWAIGPEFFYSQKGARTTSDDQAKGVNRIRVRLHYVELPLMAYYTPNQFGNFTLEGGTSIGYLFRARLENGNNADVVTERWTRTDLSIIGGFQYTFTPTLAGLARWTYSVLPTNSSYTDPNTFQILYQGAGLRNSTLSVALRIYLKN
jgi:opacity protein-like surface antigen